MRYLNLDSYKENQVMLLNYKALDEFQIFNYKLQLTLLKVKKNKALVNIFWFAHKNSKNICAFLLVVTI